MKLAQLLVSWVFILAGFVLGVLGVMWSSRMPNLHNEYGVLALIGFVPMVASVLAIRNRKQAGILYLIGAIVMGANSAWPGRSQGEIADVHHVLSILYLIWYFVLGTLLFAVPSAFWLVTNWRRWPEVSSAKIGLPLRIAQALLLFITLVGVGTLLSVHMWSTAWGDYNCGATVSVRKPSLPNQALFTAKIIYVGHPLDELGLSHWALARVEQRYWGIPSSRDVVVLEQYFHEDDLGEEYLVDAVRAGGALTRFLPIYEARPCLPIERLDRAAVEMRVLRDGPRNGVRVIGRVYSDMYTWSGPVSGAEVLLSGPQGDRTIRTDSDGIYDAVDLPDGQYSVRLVPNESQPPFYNGSASAALKSGDVWGPTLYYWHPIRRLKAPSATK